MILCEGFPSNFPQREIKHVQLKSIKQWKDASRTRKICIFYPQTSNCSISHVVKEYKNRSVDHHRDSEEYASQSGMPCKQKELANTKKLQISGMFTDWITNSPKANIYPIFASENDTSWPILVFMLSFQSFKTLFKWQLVSYTPSIVYPCFEHMFF